ncbi:uncharacterized protein C8orf76 homolog [Babylonia areolata]|uniref:uncharacterized protein C8orf76 homolog n=1 Tax=Babylonia areolata TaxID=304850 RepID=UPI003FD4E5CC
MDLGLGFDDDDFERKQKTTAGTKTSYNAKICSPLWFEGEEEEASDPNTYIHQQKFSADYHFYKGGYEIAATKYKMLLERIPESNMPLRQDVQESLCRSYTQLGRHQESLDIAYRMVERMRTEDEARQRQSLILLSQACREAKDWTGCIGALEELVSGQSHFAHFWLELGRAYQWRFHSGGGDRDCRNVAEILTCFARARVLLESVQNTAVKGTRERNEATISKINKEIQDLGATQELVNQAVDVMRADLEHNSAGGEEDEKDNGASAAAAALSPDAFRKRWFSWIDKHGKT